MNSKNDQEFVHHSHIIKLIELIRDSFGGSTIVYTMGSCTKFAMILKYLYPQGEILSDHLHTIFEYNGNCYDINGYAEKTDAHKPITDWGLLRAYDWMTSRYEI